MPIIGREIIHLPTTTSTNDEIEKLVASRTAGSLPVKEGVVVWADEQTVGRGRMGRVWNAPHGKDLLFSVLLRPPWPPEMMTRLTVLAAVAVARVVGRVTSRGVGESGKHPHASSVTWPTIKWPNDVLLNGKKVAGILVETRMETPNSKLQLPKKLQSSLLDPPSSSYAILGIGLNVNSTARDFPPALRKSATSLHAEIKALKAIDREPLLSALLAELDIQYQRAQQDFAAVADEWADRCATLGKYVAVQVGGRRIEGTAHRLDDDGALIVRTESGRQERIVGGNIVLEKSHV